MFKYISLFLISICLTLSVSAENNIMTPGEYAEKVLAYSPLLKKQDMKTSELDASGKIISSFRFPKITFSSSLVRTNDPVNVFGLLLKQGEFTQNDFNLEKLNNPDPRTGINFDLGIGVLLFNAFQTLDSLKSLETAREASEQSKKYMEQAAIFLASETYFKAILAKMTAETASQTFTAAAEDLKQAEDLKEKGVILGADFFSAKVMHAQMEQILVKAEKDSKNTLIAMNILIGENPENILSFLSSLPDQPPVLDSPGSMLKIALENRNDLKALKSAIESCRIETEREKSTRLPKVYGFGNMGADSENPGNFETSYMIGVKASIDIFEPSYNGRYAKISKQLDQLKQEESILDDQITKDIYDAHATCMMLLKNISISESAVMDASESLKLLEPLYREGRKSIADLLEIRMLNFNVRQSLYQLLYNAEISYLHLLFLSGTLDVEDLNDLSIKISGDLNE